MMSKEQLLIQQQSALQWTMRNNKATINNWKDICDTAPNPRNLNKLKGLQKRQYALSKLLKSVEQEIRLEADKRRLMEEMTAIAQEQGEYD